MQMLCVLITISFSLELACQLMCVCCVCVLRDFLYTTPRPWQTTVLPRPCSAVFFHSPFPRCCVLLGGRRGPSLSFWCPPPPTQGVCHLKTPLPPGPSSLSRTSSYPPHISPHPAHCCPHLSSGCSLSILRSYLWSSPHHVL